MYTHVQIYLYSIPPPTHKYTYINKTNPKTVMGEREF